MLPGAAAPRGGPAKNNLMFSFGDRLVIDVILALTKLVP